jgi:hypothetical protein
VTVLGAAANVIARWLHGRRAPATGRSIAAAAGVAVAALALLSGIAVIAAGNGALVLQPGEQLLRVRISDGAITLDPPTAPAGVPLHVSVHDDSRATRASLVFASLDRRYGMPADEPPLNDPDGDRAPLDDAALARLLAGDRGPGSVLEPWWSTGSFPAPSRERYVGRLGALEAGRYLFFFAPPETGDGTEEPPCEIDCPRIPVRRT